MEKKKVLWPTDFSNRAEHALDYITSLMERYDADVHVLYVIEDIARHPPLYGEFKQPHVNKLTAWEKETAEKRLDQICEKYLNQCLTYKKHIAVGDPALEILKFARDEGVQLIVMPTRGKDGKFSYGSITQEVLQNSTIPVVTIPVLSEN